MRLASIPAAAAACVLLVACADVPDRDPVDEPMEPTAPTAPIPDAGPPLMRWLSCEHQGTSSASGSGPAGPLLGYRVYAGVVSGFCPLSLSLTVAPEAPLSYPFLDGTIRIWAPLPENTIFGTADWSGTFVAEMRNLNGDLIATGAVAVTLSTPASAPTPALRATVVFNDAGWTFSASVDAPYCHITNCL